MTKNNEQMHSMSLSVELDKSHSTATPLIIDGVDVSGCCQYMPRYMEDYDVDTLDYCGYYFKPCKDVDVKYCYFKQLKRKEQECENNKIAYQIELDIYNQECLNLQEELKEALDQLDQFKETNEGLLSIQYKLADNNKQLRQTLEEIREIIIKAQEENSLINISTILQKINEVIEK